MFKKLFGSKETKVSKGYHSCVTTCEQEIENLETEIELQKKDNVALMAKVSTLQVQRKVDEATITTLEEKVENLTKQVEELAGRLTDADSTPVKYASARKTLTKAKLKALRARLEAVPSNAQGFGGSVSVYDKKTKRVSVVEFQSKADAMAILEKAEKGNVDIIM